MIQFMEMTIFILLIQMLLVGVYSRKADHSFHLHDLRVDCLKDGMAVTVEFQDPFRGIVYSKGYHETPQCRYVTLVNNGPKSYNFVIPKTACGTAIETQRGNRETVMENVIIIQNDPDITEAWDAARKLRCIWRQSFAKIVTSRPFQVQRSANTNFTDDAANAVVRFHTGRGSFSAPRNSRGGQRSQYRRFNPGTY